MKQRENNFDLLRLLAALQVVWFHGYFHLKIELPEQIAPANGLLSLFPGVPIFFVISGYLVSASYERSPDVCSYFRNRFLRLYPGLWVAFAVSLGLVGGFGFLTRGLLCSGSFWFWVTTQLSFMQLYNPAAFRGFGVGVVNGSLWTIPIEITFYVALPAIYRWLLYGRDRAEGNLRLIALALPSYFAFFAMSVLGGRDHSFLFKLIDLTLVPHLWMFLLGVLLQRNADPVRPWIEGRVGGWTLLYVPTAWLYRELSARAAAPEASVMDIAVAFAIAVAARTLLACWAISFALSLPGLGRRILRGNDLSYGVYIYHALIFNAFIELGWTGRPIILTALFAASLGLAWLSWRFVERPALRLKRSSIHQ